MKITTPHLSYEHGFVSIIQNERDDIPCGQILETGADTCMWPFEAQIEEPDWFFDEICDLVDKVMNEKDRVDHEMTDYENQINADYLRGKGAK